MKEILLTQGFVALVDDADFEAVSVFKWHAHRDDSGCVYAARNVRNPDGSQRTLCLHRFILPGGRIDHRDGNGLNNQRANLRKATRSQNGQAFRRKSEKKSSVFRGVSWHKSTQKWSSNIRPNKKPQIYLGLFELEKDAALAYDKAAREIFGDFATPNFPTTCRD